MFPLTFSVGFLHSSSKGWCARADLEHDGTLFLRIDGDVCARHPGVGAQVPQSHIGVSESVGQETFQPLDIK